MAGVEHGQPQRFCRWCQTWKYSRGFHMHEPACKRSVTRAMSHRSGSINPAVSVQPPTGTVPGPTSTSVTTAAASVHLLAADSSQSSETVDDAPYFKLVYHPHSLRSPDIVHLDGDPTLLLDGAPAVPGSGPRSLLSGSQPWAPFASYADFTFAEAMVNQRRSGTDIDAQLDLIASQWSRGGSNLSFRSHRDLQQALDAAKSLIVPFQEASVTEIWEGQPMTYTFEYRDPWQWILGLLKDPALAAVSNWHAFRKFLCADGKEERWFDHPKSADRCWEIEDTLPDSGSYPSVYAGLHVWSDKGGVSKTTTKHPVLARATWLPSEIFSTSGHGGGELLLLMPIIPHPNGPGADAAPDSAFGLFKMRIYQKIYGVVFASLKNPSLVGSAHVCGDMIIRIIWPGVLIVSMDGEESFYFCATKATGAKIPCCCCLVQKDDLSKLTLQSAPRTSAAMQGVYLEAQALSSKTAREAHLTAHGLRDVPHFLWEFGNSDPYQARSYDELHFDDEGKWGKHLWPLILQRLEELKVSKTFDQYLSLFPPWRTIRSIRHASTREYADGNWYRDLLRHMLPCLVAVLPPNDPLIPCTRAYTKYRVMSSLHAISEGRLARLQEFISKYEHNAARVTRVYSKNFNFYKQHMCAHVIPDIRATGTLNNKTTRIGEAFQQEVKEAYFTTNFQGNVDHQIGQKDAELGVIARIRTAIDDFNRIQDSDEEESVDGEKTLEQKLNPEDGWHLGAPEGPWLDPYRFQQTRGAIESVYSQFYVSLRSTLAAALHGNLDPHTSVQIRFFKCSHVYFQSQEDFRQGHDILRCNASFRSRPRHDCITYRTSDGYLGFGRLQHIIRCKLSTEKMIDIVAVHPFVDSKWKPPTVWEDCCVYDEQTSIDFVLMDDVFRGALMCPVFGSDRAQTYYLLDDVDNDMFLRLNQL